MGNVVEIRKEKAFKFLSFEEEQRLLNRVKSTKYKFIVLLMLDGGLRVSETITIKAHQFNWQNNSLQIRTLKQKKGVERYRTVYLTERTITAASNYFREFKKKLNPDDYIFPANSKFNQIGHLTRKQVWRHLKERSDDIVHPHALRHTCATKLIANGATLLETSRILGHRNTVTTEIYAHVADTQKKKLMQKLDKESKYKAFLKKYLPFLFAPKPAYVLPSFETKTRFQVGRKTETATLHDLYDKRVNTLLIGEQGVGKSYLLDNLQRIKILRIDDTKEFKKQIAACIFQLIDTTNQFKDKIENDPVKTKDGATDIDKTRHAVILELLGLDKSVISSQSAKRLCELLCKITEKNEYTIIIDRADDITPTVIKQLEFLTTHFHFVVACRSMQVKYATWLHNFQKLKIEPLSRSEAIELIRLSSRDYRDNIENFALFETHIINKSQNIPLRILDMTDRFRKESFVSAALVANYEVVGDLREIDMSWFILLGLSGFMLMRYVGGELGHDEDAFRLFGAIGLLFAFFARSFFRATKRRYV